jgi:hypothetical protein
VEGERKSLLLGLQTIPLKAQTSIPAISSCFCICHMFHKDKEVKNEVTKQLHVQAGEFCDIGTQKLVPRLNKCLDTVGDYVEQTAKGKR